MSNTIKIITLDGEPGTNPAELGLSVTDTQNSSDRKFWLRINDETILLSRQNANELANAIKNWL